jgi:hypothetical protein
MSTLFAYHRSGSLIVVGDDAEVLVYAGEDERPLWKAPCSAGVAAVGATATEVVAVDREGLLSRWDAASGQPVGDTTLGAAPRAFALAEGGLCAVALPSSVALVTREATRTLPVEGASALAIGDGDRVAVGAESGRVAVHAADGELVGACELGAPVRGLTWSAGGFWFATAGERLYRVDAGGGAHEVVTRAEGMTPDHVACSSDGALVALRLDPRTVVALAYPSRATAATIAYVDREVTGVAFGVGAWLGVGMDRGDANKVDLRTGAVHRTDPHPGRPRNTWLLKVAVEPSALRGGAPRNPAAASAGADDSSANTARIVGYLIAGLLVLVYLAVKLGPSGSVDGRPPLSTADQAEVLRLAEQARVRGDQLAEERRAGLAAALSTLGPRPDLGSCPIDVRVPTISSNYAVTNRMDSELANAHIIVLPTDSAATRASPVFISLSVTLSHLAGEESARPEALREAREIADPAWWTYDMVIAVDEEVEPAYDDDAGYRSGMIRGRAFVWSYVEHAVVCAADVNAENSAQVRVRVGRHESSPYAYLYGDLMGEAARVAREHLHRAGPRSNAAPTTAPTAPEGSD